jgi:hypothetical protein
MPYTVFDQQKRLAPSYGRKGGMLTFRTEIIELADCGPLRQFQAPLRHKRRPSEDPHLFRFKLELSSASRWTVTVFCFNSRSLVPRGQKAKWVTTNEPLVL